MFLSNKIFKLLKLLKYRLWRKGLFNGIAATVELENMVNTLYWSNPGYMIYSKDRTYRAKIENPNFRIILKTHN